MTYLQYLAMAIPLAAMLEISWFAVHRKNLPSTVNQPPTTFDTIRKMNAGELMARAEELYNAASPLVHSDYAAYKFCKERYKEITGEEMPVLLFLFKSIK